MSVDLLRRALLTRRAFVTGVAAGGATVASPDRPRDDKQDIAAAERLLGLSFTDVEREQATGRANNQRRDYEALREVDVARGTAPALRFDMLPAAADPPDTREGIRYLPLTELPTIESDEDLAFATVDQLAALLRERRVTSRQLTELSITRLKKYDPVLHCVITLLEEQALATADHADAEIARGEWRGPLHGIPFGAKDLLSWPGAPTTFGAAPFKDQVLDLEATVLSRLHDAGAVLVAKMTLGALAMGDRWFGGRTRNPWKPSQGSSGSSAGSASAVAAGLLPFALGSETLGSIVSPCTRCGATGLRPTFGTVSRHGAMPLSWTMDKLGPIARSAADCALVFDAIRGPDGRDPDVIAAPFPWQRKRDISDLRIGFIESDDWERPRERAFLDNLRGSGAALSPMQLPDFPYRAMLIVLHAEAAAAFDDLTRRGGLRELVAQGNNDWPNSLRSARFIPAVEYLRAMRIRTRVIEETAEVMANYDVFISRPFGNRALTCTNLTGHPCCVLPLGALDDGRPTSITVCGKLYGEADVLAVAEHWQGDTDWHRRRPPLE